MSNIVEFTGVSRLNTPADRLLDAAKGKLERVVIVGYDNNGAEYFASSVADGGDCLWLLERCKKKLLDKAEELS